MDISIVIPWRPEPSREPGFLYVSQCLEDVFIELGDREFEVVLADDPNPIFNRGRALNAGVERSEGKILVLADSDLWVNPEAIKDAMELVDLCSYVVPFDRLIGLNEAASTKVINDEARPTDEWEISDIALDWPRRSTGGMNILRRSVFDEVGGFDPRFEGWGFEDSAFDIAATTLSGPPEWILSRAVHLWHEQDATKETTMPTRARELCVRYEKASGDTDAILELIAER